MSRLLPVFPLDTLRISACHERMATAAMDLGCLPSVIAIPLAEYQNPEERAVLRLWHACETVELTLRLAVAIGLADVRRGGALPEPLVKELRSKIERPSLGAWLDMAEGVARWLKNAAHTGDLVVPELPDFVLEQLAPLLEGPSPSDSPELSLIAMRNQLAHGGGVSKSVAERHLLQWKGRLDEAFSRFAWMDSIALVTALGTGFGVLRGAKTEPEPFQVDDRVGALLRANLANGASIALVRGSHVVAIWPLAAFGVPQCSDAEVETLQPTPQIYARRGEVRLQLTPIGSEEVCVSDSDEAAMKDFLEAFRIVTKSKPGEPAQPVRDHEQEMQRDAAKLVGRTEELAAVRQALANTSRGVLWLDGEAGIGKSCLVASIACELLRAHARDQRTIILPYRFEAGHDDRCSRSAFFGFALEGLAKRIGKKTPSEGTLLDRLAATLRSVGRRRVIFILDGLDELALRDPKFAEDLVSRLQAPGVVWLCAGRPEKGLREFFARSGCRSVFPAGLPGMGEGDVRTMLLEGIGPFRKQLLDNDREKDGRVFNAFVANVARNANGLPLYVQLVIDDIATNKYVAFNGREQLPKSLEAYYEKLLARLSVGRLHMVLTPMVGLLAVAREALNPETLVVLLSRWVRIYTDDDPLALVQRALASTASMLRRTSTPEGEVAYTLSHQKLREHMDRSPEMKGVLVSAREVLSETAERPGPDNGPAEAYLHRQGVVHLLENGRRAQAIAQLTDFGRLMRRLKIVPDGVPGVSEDWRLITNSAGLETTARTWEAFWRLRANLLEQADERWPAWRILLQLTVDHAEQGPITQAAEAWLEQHKPAGAWMRCRRSERPRDEVVTARLFTCVPGDVNAAFTHCAVCADFTRAVTANVFPIGDKEYAKLRLWDLTRQVCTYVTEPWESAITSVAMNAAGSTAIAGSADGTVRLFDVERRALIAERQLATVSAVSISPKGDHGWVACRDGAIWRWWLCPELDCERVATGSPVSAMAVDFDGGIAAIGHDDGTICFLHLSNRAIGRDFGSHEGPVTALAVHGGRVYSGGRDGVIACWDTARSEIWRQPAKRNAGGARDAIGALALVPGRDLLLSGCKEGLDRKEAYDPVVQVSDSRSGDHVTTLCRHAVDAREIAVGGPSRALSVGTGGELIAWDLNLLDQPLEKLHYLIGVYDLSLARDGSRVVVGSEDGTVRVLSTEDWSIGLALEGHRDRVVDVELSPDETRALSGGEDGIVRVWDLSTRQAVAEMQEGELPVDGVCWSPDGRRVVAVDPSDFWHVSGVQPCMIRVWDVESRACLHRIPVKGKELTMRYVRVTPDGRCLVSFAEDCALGVWDLLTGELIANIATGDSILLGLAISPDGRTCFTGHDDGTVGWWNLRTRERAGQIHTPKRTTNSRALSPTPDGRGLYVGSFDPALRFYELPTGELIAAAYLSSWVLGAEAFGQKPACAVGLGDGRVHIIELVDGPSPSTPWVTAVRLASDPARNVSAACPWCGKRFVPAPPVLETIQRLTADLDPKGSPCRLLPYEAWDHPGLESECGECLRPIRFTPFIA